MPDVWLDRLPTPDGPPDLKYVVPLRLEDPAALDRLLVVQSHRDRRIAHSSISQLTRDPDDLLGRSTREVYRVDTSHGTINEHVFHWTRPPSDRRGTRAELENIRTVRNGGYGQLAAGLERHFARCSDEWEPRLRRWKRTKA